MTARFVALAIDANDPMRLARFWAHALRWEVGDEVDGAVRLVPTDGARFDLLFVPVPEPKTGQNRIHLDLTTASLDDQRQTVEELLAVGGRHLDIGQSPDEGHVVLGDPEGNELCIIEPGNRFLAGCGRLGAINCDGTRALGYFWSAVLDWPLVWDQDEETAIRAPDGTGSKITWSGPPLMPRSGKDRLHLHIAPAGGDRDAEIERIVALGARRANATEPREDRVVMIDPDGNEFCVVRAPQP
jgi:catechol 2,3-dioxygenase-like lactoylglutathione lyase family enzyme